MKYDYLIVGAGLYGSTIANLLKNKGKRVLVIEKEQHVGGKCYTEKIDNITVHKYGAHIFHTNNEDIWNYINKYCHMQEYVHQVKAYNNGRLYSLPFNMNTFYEIYNFTTPTQVREYINSIHIDNCITLEEQGISQVGKQLFDTLIKEYTEKQWGKSCSELSKDILKRIPVRYTFDNNYFNDRYQGIPKEGYTQMIENMLRDIDVLCGIKDYKKYFDLAKHVIYTGKLDELFDYQYGKLEYRCLRFEHKTLSTENFQGCSVMNYTDKEHPFTRIIEHKHFLHETSDKTVITYEYSSNKGLECYSINDDKNQTLYEKYKSILPNNIYVGGRLAEYRYYDMDDVIEKAMKDVEIYE